MPVSSFIPTERSETGSPPKHRFELNLRIGVFRRLFYSNELSSLNRHSKLKAAEYYLGMTNLQHYTW
jgi:hypothetical protein